MKKFISFLLTALLCVSSFLFTTADAFANTAVNDVTNDISGQISVPESFISVPEAVNDETSDISGQTSFPGSFVSVPGCARDIGVGDDDSAWVIGCDSTAGGNEILRWDGSKFNPVFGGAVRIAVAPNGTPSVINSEGDIYQLNGDNFVQLPGCATNIGVGNNNSVWVIGCGSTAGNNEIYSWNGSNFNPVSSGGAVRIAVAPNGTPWIVNSEGGIFQLNGDRFVQRLGCARDIGVGNDNSAWVIGCTSTAGGNEILRWNGSNFNRVSGGAVEIAVAPNGTPWIVDSEGSIFKWSIPAIVPPSFANATNWTVGTNPESVVSGDFNKDGKLDLATANINSSNVSVLLGNGNGTFTLAGNFDIASPSNPLASNPLSVVTGDVNKDGRLDLATVNIGTDNVSILLGNGNGTFQSTNLLPVGDFTWSLVAADVNKDGRLDLATANSGSNNVSILLGNGDGTFRPATNFPVGTNPWSIVAADVNGDSRLDLATANYTSNNVSVLLGNGDGTFRPATNFPVGTNPYSVLAADVNGDGRLDLATANMGSNNVSVLLGNGDGTFRPATNFPVGTNPYSVLAADVNGDGRLDLATANSGSNNVSVLLGNGDGTFQSATNFPVGTNPYSIVSADFNGDGRLDLATANRSSNNVSVLINTGTFNVSK